SPGRPGAGGDLVPSERSRCSPDVPPADLKGCRTRAGETGSRALATQWVLANLSIVCVTATTANDPAAPRVLAELPRREAQAEASDSRRHQAHRRLVGDVPGVAREHRCAGELRIPTQATKLCR